MNKTSLIRPIAPLLIAFLIGVSALAEAEPAPPDVLTLSEAAELLRLDEQTLELMAQAETIPGRAVRLRDQSTQWLFSRDALIAWLERSEARRRSMLSGGVAADSTDADSGGQVGESTEVGTLGQERTDETSAQAFRNETGVLVEKGEFSMDVGTFYTRRDRQLLLSGSSALATQESRLATLQSNFRYSFADETEIFLRSRVIEQQDELYLLGERVGDKLDETVFEADLGFRAVAVEEDVGRPEIILGLDFGIPTDDSSFAAGASVTFLKSLDPAVLYGTLAYRYTDGKDFDNVALLEASDRVSASFGYAFQLNDDLSLNSSFELVNVSETRFSRATIRQNDFATMQFGMTARVTRNLFIQPVVGYSLNGTSSAYSAGANLVIKFSD